MKILAIETSCDDTCVAIIKASGKKQISFDILSNIVSSQIEIHKKWGGVCPFLAKREHQKNLLPVLEKALKKAKNPKIDAIAVTIGPGLEPCLWVGINFAKALSYLWNLPIIPVNHIEAHILANWLPPVGEVKNQRPKVKSLFPAICLVVSGGHTQLILMNNFRKYKILGETRDDAAGECFDKTARILGLGYPGGPAIAKRASQWKTSQGPSLTRFSHYLISNIKLPRPMLKQKNYDFSFSGLKTAVLYNFKKQPPKIRKKEKYIKEMCYEIQQAIIDVLIKKTIRAAKAYRAKTIILGGGVAANTELRKQFKKAVKKEIPDSRFQIPDSKFCTDNAIMVGVTGYFKWLRKKTKKWEDIEAKANLRIS